MSCSFNDDRLSRILVSGVMVQARDAANEHPGASKGHLLMTLPELFDQLSIRYWRSGESHHVSNGWLGTDCFQCSPNSGRAKLGWSTKYPTVHCWTCGKVDRLDALMQLSGHSPRECIELLRQLEGWDENYREQRKLDSKLVLPKNLGPLLPVHRDYLRMRGFDPNELVRLWQLQGIGLDSRLAWRIFIPITWHGRTVSWTTRAISDENHMRYVTAKADEEAIPAKSLLFGMDYCRHACLVTEGPFDVFRIGPGAVAVMGTQFTRAQVEQIARFPVRAIVFDQEPHAQSQAVKLCQALGCFPGTTQQVQLNAADPGSASKKEIQQLRKSFLE